LENVGEELSGGRTLIVNVEVATLPAVSWAVKAIWFVPAAVN
jgi:hypothetical protein